MAAHLLRNRYNQKRNTSYRRLDSASKSGGDILPFIEYAVEGFVEQLRERIRIVNLQQQEVSWINDIHDVFSGKGSSANRHRRGVIFALSVHDEPIKKQYVKIFTPAIIALYALKDDKTLSRDLNVVRKMNLPERTGGGYKANKKIIFAFVPPRKPSSRVRNTFKTMRYN